MSKYIELEEAIKEINALEYPSSLVDVKRKLMVLPTIDIESCKADRPQGEWIHDTHYGLKLPEHKCSECGTWEYSDEESNFCPNCGADMRGEEVR